MFGRFLEFDTSEWDLFTAHLKKPKFFSKEMKRLTEQIAEFLLITLQEVTPVGKTFEMDLANGWDKKIVVTKEKTGYLVKLVNTCEYATWVNDGHYSYNDLNYKKDPYLVHEENRTVPLQPEFYKGKDVDFPHYVYGWFFVENSIIEAKESDKLDEIIMEHLLKWWEWL